MARCRYTHYIYYTNIPNFGYVKCMEKILVGMASPVLEILASAVAYLLPVITFSRFFQKIPQIPDELKALYKTVWEISQKTLVNMAADRGAFIDQSQSFNIHMEETNFGKMTSMHFYGWKKARYSG